MCEHFVQFYKNDAFLINEVASYIGPAIQAGAAGIVIATRRHLEQLDDRLRQGVAPLHPVRCPAGTYLPLDAEDLLSQFMVAGQPDAARFNAVMEEIFRQPPVSACERVLAFGEMVALLASAGRYDAALALEKLWNQLAKRFSFTLLCAYPIDALNETSHEAVYRAICESHSRVWPSENPDEGNRPAAAGETIMDAAALAAPRVIRDGFSMPPTDYEILFELKQRLLKQKRDVTKSGLLRAGLRKLRELNAEELAEIVDALDPIKQGRPAKR